MRRELDDDDEPPPLWPFGWVQRLLRFLTLDIWQSELIRPLWYRRAFYRVVRILALVSQRFVTRRSTFHAAALTYFTMLSIVPLLALVTATARGLGYYDTFKEQVFEPFLEEYIPDAPPSMETAAAGPVVPAEISAEGASAAPTEVGSPGSEAPSPDVSLAGPQGGSNELRGWIDSMIEEVDQVNSSSLGLIGLCVLILTVIKLMGTVEGSFNEIWEVRRARSVVRKLSDYLTLLLISPLLLLLATAVGTWLNGAGDLRPLGFDVGLAKLTGFFVRFAPLVAIWGAFALTYLTLPNARTNVSSALLGGVFGGTLWHVTQLAYFRLQVGLADYNAVVAGFAFVPMLLFWVYLSWVMVLMGAHVAFAHQHERSYRGITRFREADFALREGLALRAMLVIARSFAQGEEGWTTAGLSLELGVPLRPLEKVFERLTAAGLIAPVEVAGDARYLPGRDLDRIDAKAITDAMRVGPGGEHLPSRTALDRYAADLVDQLERSQAACTANRSLRAMLAELGEVQRPPG